MDTQPSNKAALIKNLYLYLVSFVALMMVVISTADIIDVVLRTFIFTKADNTYYSPYGGGPGCERYYPKGGGPRPEIITTTGTPELSEEECAKIEEYNRKQEKENQSAQRQRDLVRDISFILVGVPLFLYHWRIIRRKE